MKIRYDKEADVIYISLSDAEIVESVENKPGLVLDYDKEENIVGIEIIQASKKTNAPASVVYEFGD